MNLPSVVGKKNEIKTSIWRPSSQTAGCIKGPVCLFHVDPVTFTHPRTGCTGTPCEKTWRKSGVFTGGGDRTCIKNTLCKKIK